MREVTAIVVGECSEDSGDAGGQVVHATPQGLIGSKKVSTKTMHEGPYLAVLGG